MANYPDDTELLAGVEDSSQVETVTDTAAAPIEQPAQTQTTQAQQVASELEFDWNGNKIKAPYTDPRVKTWAAQGYDYAQRMEAFKREQAELQERARAYEPYQKVDEYARQNPEWWAKFKKMLEQKDAPALDPSNPLVGEITGLRSALTEQSQMVQQLMQDHARKQQMEDQALDNEIKSVREKYPYLDLSAVDTATGKTLEMQVLEFQANEGPKSFDAAFRLFNHDRLQKYWEDQGKESVLKEKQKLAKAGVVGKSDAPTLGQVKPPSNRRLTEQELWEEGVRELGIAL